MSRLLGAVPAAAGNVLEDPFTRVEANGWGTPSTIGPPYAVLGGNAADFSVNGTEGVIANVATLDTIASPLNLADVNAACRIFMGAAGVGGVGSHRLIVRAADASNYYYIELNYASFGATYNASNLGRRVAGVDTVLVAGPNPGVASVFVRLVATGSTITASLWTASEGAPFATAQDLALTAPGSVGASRGAVINSTMSMDNLVVTSPGAIPIWDAYVNDSSQLINLIDSSVVPVDRWIPQITNGQRLNPGDELIVVPRSGQVGSQAIVTCSFVYST